MSQLTSSALDQHYLQAILPHPLPPQHHFLKNKDFYKPEQFIWNNPHRTSDRMFQFYHAYNHHYETHKAPLIQKMEAKDREEEQQARISRLIDFRNKTRQQFHQTQKQRKMLENKAQQRHIFNEEEYPFSLQTLQPHSEATIRQRRTSNIKQGRTSDVREGRTRYKTHMKSQPQSHRLIKIQDSYKQGVEKHDMKEQEIQRLIKDQNQMYHSKIRSEFLSRKLTNDTQSAIYPPKSHLSKCSYTQNKKNTIS